MYDIEGFSAARARDLVLRKYFRVNSGVTDPRVKEVLLAKGEMELKETLEQWKQKPHMIDLLKEDDEGVDPFTPEEVVRRCVVCGYHGKRGKRGDGGERLEL
jgi:hypothetical protein